MPFVLPKPLVPGDLVAVVAPSSPFDHADFWRGLAWVRDRYRVRATRRILSRSGYLAGDDAARCGELGAAMADLAVKAVLVARGGYGAMRLLDALPWETFRRRPVWIVGFSDVTALHLCATGHGIASIHGPNVTGLGPLPPRERRAWLVALERPRAEQVWRGLEVVHPGKASGPIVGGNLALLHAMAASARLSLPDGAVLALEDVTERPYRVDRMLTSLRLGGNLSRVSAIVFGDFTRCEPAADGVTVNQVLAERTEGLGIPVLARAPFGHGGVNEAFVMGRPVRVQGDQVVMPTTSG